MKRRKLLLLLLPSLWLAMTHLAVSAEEGPSSEEVSINQALDSEILPEQVRPVDDSNFQAEEVEQVQSADLYSSENIEAEEDPTVVETANFETERLEHVINPNAPPSEGRVDVEETSLSSSFSLEELESDFADADSQDLVIQEGHADPNHPDYLEDDHVAIIVETKDRPALNLADYQDREAFEQAVENADEEVQDSYSAIQGQLAKLGYDLEARHQYSASFTGFSAFVPQWVAEELRLMDQVVSVSEQQQVKVPRDEPSMHSSPEMIDLIKMYEHELPYKGAGMVVAVIDTGIDPDHPDFVLADDVEMRYTEEEMNAKIDELGLKGRWYSNKIPYGYNYIDDVQTVKDRNEHGIHVAGTIGANGDPANGGVRGVAPHVQILAMKAFSNDPGFAGVYEDTWMKAFDDSIKLGADVINMSLGGTAGFSLGASKPSAQAFQLARSKGIIPVVANGNDRNINWGNDLTSLKDNPDTLLTGSPALIQESLAVASVDNIRQMVSYVEVTYGDGQVETFEGASVDPFLYTEEAYPFIEAGLGRDQDYGDIESLDGHYVIVQRGESTFADKYDQAASRGAEGIIVYDNVDSESLLRMGGVNQPKVPMIMLHRQSGLRILELQELYDNVQVRVPQGMIQKETPTGNQVSEFSTWGPTNDLRLKPEIAAPGGNIYSLMSDGKYQDMSGTSMATPHIAGVAALVMERLIKDGYITEENEHMKDDLATLMMMNTATPLVNTQADSKHYFSPIQQGAGLVNVYNAVTNDVIVMATGGRDTTPDGKLELGDKIGSRFDFQLIFYNFGDEARTYDIETELIRDLFDENNRYTEETTYAQVNWLGQVTIQPGQMVVYNYTQPTFRIENNQYIQGYITMHSAQPDEAPNLSIPILGFKGEWDQLPIVDKLASFSPREEINIKPLSLGNLADGTEVFLDTGFTRQPHDTSRLWTYWNAWNTDLDRTVFVNPQPHETYVSEVTPIFSFLRDGVDVDYFIEDHSGEKIRHLNNRMTVTKVNRLYLRPTNYLQVQPSWDFTDADGDLVADGIYKYVVTGRIDDPAARKQRHEYTIVVDQTPVQVNSRVDGNLLTLQLSDNVSGINQYAILNNTATQILEIVEVDKAVNPRLLEKEVLFTIPADFMEQDLIVLVIDNSGNVAIEFLSLAPVVEEVDPNEDWLVNQEVDPDLYTFEEGILTSEMPVLAIQTPGIFAAYGLTTEEIVISGTVANFSELHRLEYQFVNFAGQVVDSNTLEAVRYLDDSSGTYYYSGRVDMTDKKVSDQYKVRVRAYVKSDRGNLVQHQVARPIYVDYVAPYLEVKQVYGPDDSRAYFEITFGDDHPYVGVYRDNDFVTQVDNTYNSLAPIPVSGQVTYDFKLKPGKEQALFVAEDIVGNRTEQLVDIVANRSLANVVEEVNALDETTEEISHPVETETAPRVVRKVVAPVADGQPIVPREPAVLAGGLSQVAFTFENEPGLRVEPEVHVLVAEVTSEVSEDALTSEGETEETIPVENETNAEVVVEETPAPEVAEPEAEADSEAEKVVSEEVASEGSEEPTEEATVETPVQVENETVQEVKPEETPAPEVVSEEVPSEGSEEPTEETTVETPVQVESETDQEVKSEENAAPEVVSEEVASEGSEEPTEEATVETPVQVESETVQEVQSEENTAPEVVSEEVTDDETNEPRGSEETFEGATEENLASDAEETKVSENASQETDGDGVTTNGNVPSANDGSEEERESDSEEKRKEVQADQIEKTFALVDSDHGVEVTLPSKVQNLYAALSVRVLEDVKLTTDILDDYELAYYAINLLDENGDVKSLNEPVVVKLPNHRGLKARGVYYLPSAESQPELIENMKQNPEDGSVEFITDHFSVYVVAFDKESEDLADDKSSEKSLDEARQDLASSLQDAKDELEEVKKQALSSGNKTQELEEEIKAAKDLLKDEAATVDDLNKSQKTIDELRKAIAEKNGPSIPVSYPSEAAQSSAASNRLPATGENPFNHLFMLVALISIFAANLLFAASFKI